MPERGAGSALSLWRRIGALLPAGIRDRVYEPALTDLWYRWVTSDAGGRRSSFSLRAAGTLVGCVPMALAALFVDRGRVTRLGRFSLRLVVGVVVLVVVIRLVATDY